MYPPRVRTVSPEHMAFAALSNYQSQPFFAGIEVAQTACRELIAFLGAHWCEQRADSLLCRALSGGRERGAETRPVDPSDLHERRAPTALGRARRRRNEMRSGADL